MNLYNDIYYVSIDKVDYPLRWEFIKTYNYVFNLNDYKEDTFHSAFLLNVKNGDRETNIAFIGSFFASPDHCAVLNGSKLTVLMNDEIFVIDLEKVSILMHKLIGDDTYFSIYGINDGYIVHGELSILRLNKEFEQEWDFFGSDIWVTQNDMRQALRIIGDKIFLEDWNGIKYTLDMDGQLINETNMQIKKIDYDFSICKVSDFSSIDFKKEYFFIGKTDEENSLVCITESVPHNAVYRDDGWKAFRIQGVLDFSLIGILAKISTLLAENNIGIFAVSTYNTDYIFTRKENFQKALDVLSGAGYEIV